MKNFAPRTLRLGVAALLAVGLITPAIAQQTTQSISVGGVQITGVPDDWSHHRLVFSNPGTAQEAIQKGTYDHWFNIVNDPRYIIQQLKRRAPAQGPAAEDVARIEEAGRANGTAAIQDATTGQENIEFSNLAPAKRKIKKDWSVGLGAGTPMTAVYPATWSANPTLASCANDFAIYVTGSLGSSSQASIIAYNNLYTGCTGTVPQAYWAYNTSATANTSPILSPDGTQIAFVEYSSATGNPSSVVLLKWHSNTTGRGVTGSLSASSPNVTLTSGTFTQADVGAQISGTNIPAGDTIASVLSGTTANLAVAPTTHAAESLTISAEALATPGVAPTVTAANYRSCTAPCMTTLPLTHAAQDVYSSVYYAFGSDALFVGDNSGYLHQFTGIFTGTPSTTEPSPFPVQLAAGAYALSSPIVDENNGLVMVGNLGGASFWVTTAGTVSASTGATSSCAGTNGINDAALVDSFAQREYVFLDEVAVGANFENQVVEYNLANSPPTQVATENVGFSETERGGCLAVPFFSGNFDNVYFLSANNTGSLYVIGNSEGPSTLYRLPIASNTLQTPVTVATLSDGTFYYGRGSSVTEFCNNGTNACTSDGTKTTSGTDYIFFSVFEGTLTGCTDDAGGSGSHGCIISYNVSNPASPTTTGPLNVTAPVANPRHATGGIIVDNALTSGTLHTSNIYFNTRDTAGTCTSGPTGICAVQASQAAP